ncbi:MAG: hypothetical protein ACP5I7_05190 [Sulfolobales archaeon]
MDYAYVRRDITPPVGIRLGGYGHRLGLSSTHVIDPLYLRILYLVNRSGDSVVITQLDLLGLYREDAEKIRDIISGRLGVNRSDVMIATTHTHSAPETIIPMWTHTFPYTKEQKDLYETWFRKLLEIVKEASDDLIYSLDKVSSIRSGYKKVSNLCFNRAFRDGVVDNELSILGVEGDREKIIVANYACHPVTNVGLGISSDYPGEISRQLSRKGFEVIFLTGACGDIDPLQKGVRYMSYLGSVLSEEILSLYYSSEEILSEDLRSLEEEIVLRTRAPNKDLDNLLREYESLKSIYGDTRNLLFDSSWIDLLYLDEELDLLKRDVREIRTIIQVIRIGADNVIIGIPGEVLSETSLSIKEQARSVKYRNIMISAYTNDYIGYIPIERSFIENKYEAKLAKWSFLEKNSETLIKEKILGMLIKLAH